MRKVCVYYREYSTSLETYLAGDSGLSFTKDGAQAYLNHKVPRISIYVASKGNPVIDRKRVKDLIAELGQQKKSGLIIDFW